jgi:hypothetical protein
MQAGVIGALAIAAAVCGGALAGGLWLARRRAPSPAERERLRRLMLARTGRMTDAVLTDVDGDLLCYSFSARGVAYMASQDVSTLRHLLPEDLTLVVGPVTVRYLWKNPANSIVICEEWSGIRIAAATPRRLE